jgi:hypothetical protein
LPGFDPQWTLRAGIEELYHAFTKAELTATEWSSDRYFRLKTVRSRLDRGEIGADLRALA